MQSAILFCEIGPSVCLSVHLCVYPFNAGTVSNECTRDISSLFDTLLETHSSFFVPTTVTIFQGRPPLQGR